MNLLHCDENDDWEGEKEEERKQGERNRRA